MNNPAYANTQTDRTATDRRAPRARRASNDNRPPETEWARQQPAQEARIVSKADVLRQNITAESLNAVADWQRGERGKVQRKDLRSLARAVQEERGW